MTNHNHVVANICEKTSSNNIHTLKLRSHITACATPDKLVITTILHKMITVTNIK